MSTPYPPFRSVRSGTVDIDKKRVKKTLADILSLRVFDGHSNIICILCPAVSPAGQTTVPVKSIDARYRCASLTSTEDVFERLANFQKLQLGHGIPI